MNFEQLKSKEAAIAVVGLGYVGLPVALELARHFKVIGFDINEKRIKLLQAGKDPNKELEDKAFQNTDILFTDKSKQLAQANFYIIAVPTPIDEHKVPDLYPLFSACKTVGKVLQQGDYVVFESTVYPGCTEEDCVPILEKTSGLTFCKDFKVGYSPERINPGDKQHGLADIPKVVSGCDAASLDLIARVYGTVVTAGIHKAPSIKVAEAAKVIENTQRDLNIALVNELALIFDKLNINTGEVLDAAATKWNFVKYVPGLVGGHCIGVDPYYLTYKAKELGHNPEVILSGRRINDAMPRYIIHKALQLISREHKDISQTRALIMGATFKENVSDIRNSRIIDLVKELEKYNVSVDVMDPHADPEELELEYGIKLVSAPTPPYDVIIFAVNHKEYLQKYAAGDFKKLSNGKGIFIDIKGAYKGKINGLTYWSL